MGEVVPVGCRCWVYGNSVLSTQFCCQPKIALKIKSIFKKEVLHKPQYSLRSN